MTRRLWLASAAIVPALVLSVPVLYIVSIWTSVGRLAGIATILLFVCLPAVPLFWIWTADNMPPRNLPARQRRALRAERDRIHMEAAIAEAEREAGIRP